MVLLPLADRYTHSQLIPNKDKCLIEISKYFFKRRDKERDENYKKQYKDPMKPYKNIESNDDRDNYYKRYKPLGRNRKNR